MRMLSATIVALSCVVLAAQTTDDPKQRSKAVKDLGKLGSESIPKIQPFLHDPVIDVRVEAVKAIVEIGTQRSLDPLIEATRDADAEVQIRATDGLVNFYVPGYVKSGLSGSIKRVGTAIKSKFTDTNDLVIDAYIQVRPEVVAALGKLARGGSSMESRANAARAVGVLRGGAALDDLIEALRSKDDQVIYESLVAIQKIRNPEAAPRIAFLLRDLNEKVQVAAIETTGLLQNKSASPDLRDVINRAKSAKVRRAALTALAMLPDETNREVYWKHFADKDDGMRAAAAEGIGRLRNPADNKTAEFGVRGRVENGPATVDGLCDGAHRAQRADGIQSLAVLGQYFEFKELPRRGAALPGGVDARCGSAENDLRRPEAGVKGREDWIGSGPCEERGRGEREIHGNARSRSGRGCRARRTASVEDLESQTVSEGAK